MNELYDTPEKTREVVDEKDLVLRNLEITQSYADLTHALARRLGTDDLNWCGFATWASKQAGVFIRNEEVPAPLRRFLDLEVVGERGRKMSRFSPAALLRRKSFLRYVRATVDDVRLHIVDGNFIVYSELGPLFARFIAELADDASPDAARLAAFTDSLASGPTEEGGQERLRQAFSSFYAALFEPDPKTKAELVFLANALVGYHEQIRLQEPIAGSLTAPFDEAVEAKDRRFMRLPLPLGLRRGIGRGVKLVLGPWIEKFERDWQRVATESFLTLALPDRVLDLGDDVPPLDGGEMYAPELQEIQNPDAVALLSELDRDPSGLAGSGARNWADLGDRMGYIVDFFRSRQREGDLFRPPFDPRQTEAIREGTVPAGRL